MHSGGSPHVARETNVKTRIQGIGWRVDEIWRTNPEVARNLCRCPPPPISLSVVELQGMLSGVLLEGDGRAKLETQRMVLQFVEHNQIPPYCLERALAKLGLSAAQFFSAAELSRFDLIPESLEAKREPVERPSSPAAAPIPQVGLQKRLDSYADNWTYTESPRILNVTRELPVVAQSSPSGHVIRNHSPTRIGTELVEGPPLNGMTYSMSQPVGPATPRYEFRANPTAQEQVAARAEPIVMGE